jgi:ABC-type sugar transport system ATPase subunit
VLAVSDRVIIMSHGKIVARMENQNLDKDALMRLI